VAAQRVCGLVADHPGLGESQAEVVARLEQQTGGRFAAVANPGVAGCESVGMMQTVGEASEANACRREGPDELVLYVSLRAPG
jgi:hypothetical protein